MVDNLVIVESPAKAETIKKFLGKDFTVKSSFGHIRDLPEKKLSIDVAGGFKPEYVVPADKKKVVASLGAAAAMVYDLLRAVRLRRRYRPALTHALDAVYAAAVAVGALWMAVILGGGTLRLYMLTGAAAGALLWWLWPARALRPVWDFWLDAASDTVHLLLRPFKFLWKMWAKAAAACKKFFSFAPGYDILEDKAGENTGLQQRRGRDTREREEA